MNTADAVFEVVKRGVYLVLVVASMIEWWGAVRGGGNMHLLWVAAISVFIDRLFRKEPKESC